MCLGSESPCLCRATAGPNSDTIVLSSERLRASRLGLRKKVGGEVSILQNLNFPDVNNVNYIVNYIFYNDHVIIYQLTGAQESKLPIFSLFVQSLSTKSAVFTARNALVFSAVLIPSLISVQRACPPNPRTPTSGPSYSWSSFGESLSSQKQQGHFDLKSARQERVPREGPLSPPCSIPFLSSSL